MLLLGRHLNWGNPQITYSTTYLVSQSVAMTGGGLCLAHDTITQHLIEQGMPIAPFKHRAKMPEAYYLLHSLQAEKNPGAVSFSNWVRTEIKADGPT